MTRQPRSRVGEGDVVAGGAVVAVAVAVAAEAVAAAEAAVATKVAVAAAILETEPSSEIATKTVNKNHLVARWMKTVSLPPTLS